LGVPLPLWGLGAFGAFYGLTLFPAGRLGRLIGPAAILAGVGGLAFILLQLLVIRRVCPLCMVIDASGLFITATELLAAPKTTAAVLSPRRKIAWTVAAAVAMSAAPVWAMVRPARPVPEMVQSLWTEGKITVVEVIDFDCRYCRMTHDALDELLASRKEAVQRIRFVLPLRAHKNARPAARAYLAALQQGKGDEMAAVLWAAKERSPTTCERLAGNLGLNLDSYNAFVADPATDREIDHRIEWLDEKTCPGLPVIWIENQELAGAQTPAALQAAWRRAEGAN
jgi:predicted DsbA family dithiol-disulfide isomerase